MASNALPDARNKLNALAADMSDALKTHETDLKVAQNTRAKLDTDREAAKLSESAFQKAKADEDDATTARNIANSNAKAALALTKRMLGDVPDAVKTIWPPGTTEIPDDLADRLSLLDKAAKYLKDHPEEEVEKKSFTQTALRTAHTALQTARSNLKQALADRVSTRTKRDEADAALRSRMSGLIEELGRLLPKDGDLWYAFGLVPPAGVTRPGIAPDDVHLRKLAPTTVTADWSSTPRAHRYRAFYQVTGRDPDFIPLDPTSETHVLLENLPTTGTLKFYVQANPAGDSPKSEVVEVVQG